MAKVLRSLCSQHYIRTGWNSGQRHFGSQIPALVRDSTQHRRVGGCHLWACSAWRPSRTAPVLPSGQAVQSAERWGQVGPRQHWRWYQCDTRSDFESLSSKVLVGKKRGVHRHTEETPAHCFAVSDHLRQQPHHPCPRRPVFTYWEPGGHVGMFSSTHPTPQPQPLEGTWDRWGRGRDDILRVACLWAFCIFRGIFFRSQLWSNTQNSVRLLPALQLGDSLSVSLWFQAAGFFVGQLWSKQPAMELLPTYVPRYTEWARWRVLCRFHGLSFV